MSGRVTVHAVARSTTTDHRGAIDAEITVGGCRGEVTLIRHDASGDLDTWGPSWETWADDEVQAALSATPEGERRALIDEIVQAVSAAGGQALSDRLAHEAEDEDDGEDGEDEEEDDYADRLVAIGGRRWALGGADRVYMNELQRIWGRLVTTHYGGSGRVSSATLDGQKLSNTRAQAMVDRFNRAHLYWDCVAEQWCWDQRTLSDELAAELIERINELVSEVTS